MARNFLEAVDHARNVVHHSRDVRGDGVHFVEQCRHVALQSVHQAGCLVEGVHAGIGDVVETCKLAVQVVVQQAAAEEGAHGGSCIHGHAEERIRRVDKLVHAAQKFVRGFEDGFDVLRFSGREIVAVLQHAALAAADVDVDDTRGDDVLVADGEHFGAVGNPVLEFLANGEFHAHAV